MSGAAASLRPIWLCADDYGISPAVSKAIRELVAQGRLNATSVMVAGQTLLRAIWLCSDAVQRIGIVSAGEDDSRGDSVADLNVRQRIVSLPVNFTVSEFSPMLL